MDLTLLIIIIVASIVAFLFVLFIIYFKEIKSYLKSHIKFCKKKAESVKTETAKPKTTQIYTVEDFKPLNNYNQVSTRDSSLEQLFSDDNFDYPVMNETRPEEFVSKEESNNDDFDPLEYENFIKSMREGDQDFSNEKKTLAQKIQELPPELKVLVVDNLLGKKSDNDE